MPTYVASEELAREFPGAVPLDRPCALVDATGRPVEFCFYADTGTGVVGAYVNNDGLMELDGDEIARVWTARPKPLTLVPLAGRDRP